MDEKIILFGSQAQFVSYLSSLENPDPQFLESLFSKLNDIQHPKRNSRAEWALFNIFVPLMVRTVKDYARLIEEGASKEQLFSSQPFQDYIHLLHALENFKSTHSGWTQALFLTVLNLTRLMVQLSIFDLERALFQLLDKKSLYKVAVDVWDLADQLKGSPRELTPAQKRQLFSSFSNLEARALFPLVAPQLSPQEIPWFQSQLNNQNLPLSPAQVQYLQARCPHCLKGISPPPTGPGGGMNLGPRLI